MRGMGEEKGKQGEEEEGGSGGGGEVESYWRRGEEDAGMWTPTDDWLQITPGISGTHAATALSLVSPPSFHYTPSRSPFPEQILCSASQRRRWRQPRLPLPPQPSAGTRLPLLLLSWGRY